MQREPICRMCGGRGDIPAYRLNKGEYSCVPCYNAQQRARRAIRPDKPTPRNRNPERDRAHYADPVRGQRLKARMLAKKAISRGKLARQPCEVCGATPTDAHHDDYSRPLDVRWLCPVHHRAHHAAERRAA